MDADAAVTGLPLRQLHARPRPRRAARGGRHRGRAAPQGLRAAAPPGREPGRLIDRDEIMRAVWPGVIVTEDSITQCVKEISRALDDAEQRLLRTLPRRGFLFAAEVSRVDAAAAAPRRRPGGPAGRDARAARAAAAREPAHARRAALRQHDRRPGAGVLRRRRHRGPDHRAVAPALVLRDLPQLRLHLQGPRGGRAPGRARARRRLRARGQRPQGGRPGADHARSSARRRPGGMSGPSASTATSPTSSTCRTASPRRWPARSSRASGWPRWSARGRGRPRA